MKFDYIINNPPYSIGNEITKEIIDNINYDEFINLMPLRAYRKNNLFRYINNKIDFIISNSYAVFDAAVNVPIFSIAKDSIDISYKDFELKYCYDRLLYKFYSENSKRQACYLDHISPCGRDNFNNIDSFFVFGSSIILTNGYIKKDQKLAEKEFEKAKKYRNIYLRTKTR